MDHREQLRQLRAAVFTANGEALAALLQARPWPIHSLQLIGDGLLAALAGAASGAQDLARECVSELRERDWDGDAELATALTARLGAGPEPMLRPLPVDLDQLADVLEGDPELGGGRIDLNTGVVWPDLVFEYGAESSEEDEDEEDDGEERWLWFSSEGSRAGYRDMQRFIDRIEDPQISATLTRALEGRGAFRRFRDEIDRWPELRADWNAYSTERQRGRARAWLAAEGYTPRPASGGSTSPT